MQQVKLYLRNKQNTPSHESRGELKQDIISKILSYTSETKNYFSFSLFESLHIENKWN